MNKKRIISASLALAMVLTGSLVSCNKVKEPPKSKRTNVYSTKELPLDESINYVRYYTYANGNVYITYDQDYTITRNELGEEVEKRKGYYWDDTLEPEIAVAEAAGDIAPYAEEPAEEVEEETEAETTDEAETEAAAETETAVETSAETNSTTDETTSGSLPAGWYYDYITETNLVVMNIEDGTTSTIVLPQEKDIGWSRSMAIDSNGIINFVYSQYTYDETSMTSTSVYTLVRNNSETGELVDKTPLNDIIKSAGYDLENVYLNNLVIGNSGEYYFVLDGSILMLNPDLTVNQKFELESGWVDSLINSEDKIYFNFYPDNGQNYIKVIENGQMTDLNSDNLKDAMKNMYSLFGAANGRIYYTTASGVSYYDIASDTCVETLNYINSDLISNDMNSMVLLPDEKLLTVSSRWIEDPSDKMQGGHNETKVNILTRIPDEEIQEEIIVRLGTIYQNYNITQMIVDFNKKNTGVRISLETYEKYINYDDNDSGNYIDGAVTQLNNEIVTGSAPDILLLDSSLPVDSYFQKGIFVDLNKYVDDPEVGINRADYLSNIFDACTTDGRLNSIITQFNVRTLLAKSEFVGTEPGWTFEEMMNTIKNVPEGMNPFFDYGREGIINLFFNNAMSSFINWETGETKFGSQGFIDFINYLKTCPEKGYWDEYYASMGEDYVYDPEVEQEMQMNFDLRYYNNKALFYEMYLSNFSSLMRARNTFATNDITAIGYPTEDGGNGAVIYPTMEFAISAQSKVADQAWTFVKYMLENNTVSYQFTPSISNLEQKAKEAKENYYYNENIDSDIEYYKGAGYSDEYIEYIKQSNQPYDDAVTEQVMSLIKGATKVARSDDELLDIINEELSGFFGGTKSAEQTANVIASRVGTYVSVNS